MKRKLYWFPIGNKLVDFLKNFRYSDGSKLFSKITDSADMTIKLGSGNFCEFPAIWVLFGSEDDIEKQDKIVGRTIEYWIDIFVNSEASPDQDFTNWSYKQAYDIERELMFALEVFNKRLQSDYKLGTKISVKEILSDGDSNAPATLNHRAIVTVEWYN